MPKSAALNLALDNLKHHCDAMAVHNLASNTFIRRVSEIRVPIEFMWPATMEKFHEPMLAEDVLSIWPYIHWGVCKSGLMALHQQVVKCVFQIAHKAYEHSTGSMIPDNSWFDRPSENLMELVTKLDVDPSKCSGWADVEDMQRAVHRTTKPHEYLAHPYDMNPGFDYHDLVKMYEGAMRFLVAFEAAVRLRYPKLRLP